MAPTTDHIMDRLKLIHEDVKDIKETVHGDRDRPGLKGRLDRLEQAESRRVWWSRATIVAALGAITASVKAYLASRGHG